MFEERSVSLTDRRAALTAATHALTSRGLDRATVRAPVAPATDALPVPASLARLLPAGLERGQAVSIDARGCDYLTLTLLAEVLSAGRWGAAVGVAGLGALALAELIAPRHQLAHLLYVPEPGPRWAEVTATLAQGVDLLLVQPPGRVDSQTCRRVDARLRQLGEGGTGHTAALLVLGAWPSARTVLTTRRVRWDGIEDGRGHLVARRATVSATDRTGARRQAEVWLPGSGLAVEAADEGGAGLATVTDITARPAA